MLSGCCCYYDRKGEDGLWFRISAGRRRKGEAEERDLDEGCLGLTVETILYCASGSMM